MGRKISALMSFRRQRALKYNLCICRSIIRYMGDSADQNVFISFPNYVHISFEGGKTKKIFFIFEIILWVFHLETLTKLHSSTWETEGFKGLVAYAKCNRDSYDSEVGFSFPYFSFSASQFSLFYSRTSKILVWGYLFEPKNVLFLRYFYTCFMLVLLIFLRL